LKCAAPLAKGRECVHTQGHDGRHSHTWQPGDARLQQIGDRLINMETGEFVARTADTSSLNGHCSRPRNQRPSETEAQKVLRAMSQFTGRPVLKSLPVGYHGNPDDPYWCPHAAGDIWQCADCNYGFERQDGSKVPVATPQQIRDDISWYFTGRLIWMGTDTEGHVLVKDVKTGKIRRAYSPNEKRKALELVAEYGLSAASRKTGIPRTTLNNWHVRGVG
jgi:hypothetical protein